MTLRSGTVLVVAALVTGLLVAAPADAATRAGILSGTVRAAMTQDLVADIEVCAHRVGHGRNSIQCDVTDAQGRYRLRVRRGRHVVVTSELSTYGDWVAARAAKGKPVKVGARRTIDFALVRGGTFSGYLRPGGQDPADGFFQVRGFRVLKDGTVSRTSTGMSNISPEGYFLLTKLPAGRWVLGIEHENNGPLRWFGATTLASTAPQFTVAAGQSVDVGTTDFGATGSLRVHPTFRGKTVRAELRLVDADGRSVGALPRRASRTGTYTYAGLAPGDYRVRIAPDNVDGTYREWLGGTSERSARRLAVVADEVARVRAPVHPPRLRATRPGRVRLALITSLTGLRWNVRPGRDVTSIEYSWYRDRRLIDRHIGDSGHWLEDADHGHRLHVCVLAHRDGHVPGRWCSAWTRTVTWDDYHE